MQPAQQNEPDLVTCDSFKVYFGHPGAHCHTSIQHFAPESFSEENLDDVSQPSGATAIALARCLAQSLRGLARTEASKRKMANQDRSEDKGVFTVPHI